MRNLIYEINSLDPVDSNTRIYNLLARGQRELIVFGAEFEALL